MNLSFKAARVYERLIKVPPKSPNMWIYYTLRMSVNSINILLLC